MGFRPWLVCWLVLLLAPPLVGAATVATEGPVLHGHAIGATLTPGLGTTGAIHVADTGEVETQGPTERSTWWPAPPPERGSTTHVHAHVDSDGAALTASATVAEHVIDLAVGELRVRDVRATARASCAGLDGASTIGAVTLDDQPLYTGATPPPNTAIPLAAGTTLFLNRQVMVGNHLTVSAIEVHTTTLVGDEPVLRTGMAMAGVEGCTTG